MNPIFLAVLLMLATLLYVYPHEAVHLYEYLTGWPV